MDRTPQGNEATGKPRAKPSCDADAGTLGPAADVCPRCWNEDVGTGAGKPRHALVLGGCGFIGRHAVQALLERGLRVSIGSRHRDPRPLAWLSPGLGRAIGWRQARLEGLLAAEDWTAVLSGIDVVINCVGILRQRGRETYERVHHLAPAALAGACAMTGVRLLHVTALGLESPVRSRFLTSKLMGERAIRVSGADWRLVRPSLLDGEGGYGARWIRRVARWPVHPLPADALGRIAALDVAELGTALATLALREIPADAADVEREFELGGPEALPIAELMQAIRRGHQARPAWRLAIPALLARLGSHACDLLHATPYSYGHYELLRHDNCPRHNRLPELLGRMPRRIGVAACEAVVSPLPAC